MSDVVVWRSRRIVSEMMWIPDDTGMSMMSMMSMCQDEKGDAFHFVCYICHEGKVYELDGQSLRASEPQSLRHHCTKGASLRTKGARPR